MDWVTIRLRYIRRDCGEWTRLWLVPLCLATSAWGDAGYAHSALHPCQAGADPFTEMRAAYTELSR
jgi:hypothetical protein